MPSRTTECGVSTTTAESLYLVFRNEVVLLLVALYGSQCESTRGVNASPQVLLGEQR